MTCHGWTNGGVAVDSSALAFLEEKEEEEEKRMDQLDDLILAGAHVSAADWAAWQSMGAQPSFVERRKEEKEEEEEEEAARRLPPLALPLTWFAGSSSWLWTSLCSCSDVLGGLFGALLGLTVGYIYCDSSVRQFLWVFGRISIFTSW